MEQIDNTRQDQPETPPEQQKAQAQVVTDVLNIVSNDQKIETNIVFVEDADDFADFEMIIEDKEEDIVEEEIFFTVEEMPKFRGGGLPEFRNWVQQNVKYPQIALENGIQGNVVVQFVVGPDGKMTNFKVLQSPDKTLADATIEVLKKANEMKNGWKPGKQRGKPVKVSFTLPVAFKIQI
jgi:protein TonB